MKPQVCRTRGGLRSLELVILTTTVLLLLLLHILSATQVQSLSFSSTNSRQRPRIPVLQYHDDWVCVNKPEGLTVHRSRGTPRSKPVLTTSVKRQLSRKVFLVHRLDHRTSGAILLAFNSEAASKLHDSAIRHGKKKYIALVRGEWNHPEVHTVDKPLKVHDVVKEAKTRFTLLATCGGDDERSSLVLCEPLTGRTHQIRRHANTIGHPIIGDSQHGDSKVNRWWRENRELNRMALHCWQIDFTMDSERHLCLAPLSEELQNVLKKTPLWESATRNEPLLVEQPYDERGGTYGRNFRQRDEVKGDES